MLFFWLLAAVMIAIALVFVLPPLLGGRPVEADGDEHRVATNVALYEDRLATLEAERAAGELTDEAFEEARLELQRELLHDAAAPGGTAPARRGPSPLAATIVAAALPLLCFGLYLRLGDLAALDPALAARPAVANAHAQSGAGDVASVEQMVAQLAARLEQQPGDGEGWLMLARSYSAMQRYAAAAEAYSRASDLLGEQPDLLVDWAEAIGMASGETLVGRPSELIDRALALQPDNARGLWLGGFAALQSSQPALAVERWRRLQAMLPPGSEAAQALASMFTEMGLTADAGGAAATAPAAPGQPAPTAAGGARIAVEVTLAPGLADRVKGDETLFVFARAAEGPRVPLAVVRTTAAALPFSTVLDESQAMNPAMTLASATQVVVGARITRGGQPTASSGDLQGFSAAVTPGADGVVRVVIGEVVP